MTCNDESVNIPQPFQLLGEMSVCAVMGEIHEWADEWSERKLRTNDYLRFFSYSFRNYAQICSCNTFPIDDHIVCTFYRRKKLHTCWGNKDLYHYPFHTRPKAVTYRAIWGFNWWSCDQRITHSTPWDAAYFISSSLKMQIIKLQFKTTMIAPKNFQGNVLSKQTLKYVIGQCRKG